MLDTARACKSWFLRRLRRFAASRYPLTSQMIRDSLAGLDRPRAVVIVHSSLSACGFVPGGADTVISTLHDWCGCEVTLAMPTHSYCYPTESGGCPVFDPRQSPSKVGAITDTFWRMRGVLRSLHPTHSLASAGPLAAELTTGHERCDTPCGVGTPYEKLVQLDAGVLMFGVTMNSCTLLHTAEDAVLVPYLYEPAPCVIKLRSASGTVNELSMRRQDMSVPRRFAEMGNWLEARNLLTRARCGRGELLWIPHAAAMHDALSAALREDPWLLVRSNARPTDSH